MSSGGSAYWCLPTVILAVLGTVRVQISSRLKASSGSGLRQDFSSSHSSCLVKSSPLTRWELMRPRLDLSHAFISPRSAKLLPSRISCRILASRTRVTIFTCDSATPFRSPLRACMLMNEVPRKPSSMRQASVSSPPYTPALRTAALKLSMETSSVAPPKNRKPLTMAAAADGAV